MKPPSAPRIVAFTLLALLALLPAGAAAQGVVVSGAGASADAGPGPYVSATGVATVQGAAASQGSGPQTLNVGVRVQVQGDDIQFGVQQANQKVDAVEAALVKAGVDQSAIQVQNFNIGPQYGPPVVYAKTVPEAGQPLPPPPPNLPPFQQKPSGYAVNENFRVSVSGVDQLAAAMSAVIAAGATNVSTFSPCCAQTGSPPSGDALPSAIAQATSQAKAEAQAAAQAAGVTLGALHSVTVQAPFQQGPFGPGMTPNWRVQVAVSYEIGPDRRTIRALGAAIRRSHGPKEGSAGGAEVPGAEKYCSSPCLWDGGLPRGRAR